MDSFELSGGARTTWAGSSVGMSSPAFVRATTASPSLTVFNSIRLTSRGIQYGAPGVREKWGDIEHVSSV